MSGAVIVSLALACVAGLASVVLGRNLTRSVFAAGVALVGLGIALVDADAGYPAYFALASATLGLGLLQLFGWMLVDVERDHLPPTDRLTWFARSLAFLLLGGGIVVLGLALVQSDPAIIAPSPPLAAASGHGGDVTGAGDRFFGPLHEGATLVGVLFAATLLAALMLLRDEREGR